MPDLLDLITRWWKRILGVMLLSLLIVGVITYTKPRKYLAIATAVPASSFAADRSRVFNENIQALYSTLGTTDDLDMIVGTGALDTVYELVAEQYALASHYKLKETGVAAVPKAASLLKRDTRVMKSEYGELKVKVWHTDNKLAPQLANAIMNQLNSIHSELQSRGNKITLEGLKSGKTNITTEIDSINNFLRNADITTSQAEDFTTRRTALNSRIQEYDKLIGEYQIMVDSKPPVLVTVEQAKETNWPDKPKRMQIMIATAVISLCFGLLAALVADRRKKI